MNFPKKALLGSLLALSATSAFAVDTADLRVIGTIAPTACTPTFAGGGVVDYGNIPTASLSASVATPLAAKDITYVIHCDAPISIGTSWGDSRAGSSISGGGFAFGLGTQGVAKIGRYGVTHMTGLTTGDGTTVDIIFKQGNGPWTLGNAGGSPVASDGTVIQSYAPVGTLIPGAYTDIAGTLRVGATIAPTSTLDLSTAITLDGLSTMTVRYL
ncbi:DUF1120 domain-containing protein [Pseudomonas sp. AL03]|uniref:DUF1120 domain-containing protein n=1 Tax=Pseudomonas sp. AL03 TaxID=3042230 RepID=UPI00249CA814|nr:DUF1120 domain-containing protein [Pseudomonas sp. AL03]MDI3270808.1 DUF1120 domain-containing protein [Pseudomonas sp. AL03]